MKRDSRLRANRSVFTWSTAALAKIAAAKRRSRGFDAVVRKVRSGFKVYVYRRNP